MRPHIAGCACWISGMASPSGIVSLSKDDLRPAPDIGQDSFEVLLEAGFERSAVDDLVSAGAMRQAKGVKP